MYNNRYINNLVFVKSKKEIRRLAKEAVSHIKDIFDGDLTPKESFKVPEDYSLSRQKCNMLLHTHRCDFVEFLDLHNTDIMS